MSSLAENISVQITSSGDLSDSQLTPAQIVQELDKYVIGQEQAKRAVAIALRNRWRRIRVDSPLRDEIMPKNIIMIGPTGVGKTEISRRLAKLARAPFVKVEASKFTEVGYVGRDVDSIVRDLMEVSVSMVRDEERRRVVKEAESLVEERILDALLPGSARRNTDNEDSFQSDLEEEKVVGIVLQDQDGVGHISDNGDIAGQQKTREKLRELLRAGKLEERTIEVETTKQVTTHMQVVGPQGFGEIEGQLKDMFASMVPKQREKKKVSVGDARKVLLQEAQDSLIEHDRVIELAKERAEQTGIVFIDEVDKICGSAAAKSSDVSREGVQRDLLPLVEGSTVSTKYGPVRTEHVLFIASGAFHMSKPSDLMPEFQGRFPIRVELSSLTPNDFVRILTEPQNALTVQYKALLQTEGVTLEFMSDAIDEIARLTAEVNSKTENIGARRLHTLLEKVLEDLSFCAHEKNGQKIEVNRNYVNSRLSSIVSDGDLSRFIL